MASSTSSKHDWIPSKDSRQWQRLLLAGENMWLFRPKEVREIYLGGTISLCSPRPLTLFLKAVLKSWSLLRLHHPEVACSFGSDSESRYMTYRVPSAEELDDWAFKTVLIETSGKALEFLEAKQELCQRKSPKNGAYLQVSPETLKGTSNSVVKIGFMFNMDHMYTDGIGLRILAGEFFQILSRMLDSTQDMLEIDLEKSNNLSAPYTSLMNEDQKVGDLSYTLAHLRQRKFLFELLPSNWGLPVLLREAKAETKTQHFFHSFRIEESKFLLQCVKEKLGSPSTINHLAHAAMVVAMLRAHPPPPSLLDSTLYSASWIDGRKYLREDCQDFVPNCRAMGEVIFPCLREYLVQKDSPKEEVKGSLMKAWEAAFLSYKKIRQQKSLLSESIPLTEYIGDQMMSREVPKPSEARKVADPFFLGDGKEENYINRVYKDPISKEELFSIENLRFAANAEGPNIIVRLSTWRDKLTLSGEWLDSQYETSFVHAFLQDITQLMLFMIDA